MNLAEVIDKMYPVGQITKQRYEPMKKIPHGRWHLKANPFKCECNRHLATNPRQAVCECGVVYTFMGTSDPRRVRVEWETTTK